ncbi:hypothetical protein FOCC_FOCC014583, partial [Frankliniella occidentalis]
RPRNVRNQQFQNAVLLNVALNPHTSTRAIAADMGADHTLIWRSMKEDHGLHPYKVSHHQKLNAPDPDRRLKMCNWFLEKIENVADPGEDNFVCNIMFTDERSLFCVWAGIVDDFVVGPYVWPNYVTAEEYADFLDHELHHLTQDLPLEVRRDMWFQQDGHRAHTSLAARGILNRDFPN